MIKCDNKCVGVGVGVGLGLALKPKGKWYCKDCSPNR